METQFEKIDIDKNNSKEEFFCSPKVKSKGFTKLMILALTTKIETNFKKLENYLKRKDVNLMFLYG